MACVNAYDALKIPTESLGQELYNRASWRDIWLNVIPRGVYPKHTGKTQTLFKIGRNEPAVDEEEWLPITLQEDEGSDNNACTAAWNDTYVGHEQDTYSPETFDLRGPIICKDELIFGFKPQEFWEKYMMGLAKRSRRSISNRLLQQYYTNALKSIARLDYTTYDQPTLTGLPASICRLTQEMLDLTAQQLMEDGATDPNSNGWITLGDMGPVFPLYIGMDASQDILRNNAAYRQDHRDAYSGSGDAATLMQRLGASMVIKNFRHIINLYPPRFTWAGGTYTRVNTWTVSNTTKGQQATISTAWRAATHEMAFVLNPWVMHEEIVEPENSVAGNAFNPTSYFGEWHWVTGGREIMDDGSCYDPLKKYGRHFAQYKHAIKPIFPEFGRAIIFKRCPAEVECVTCS